MDQPIFDIPAIPSIEITGSADRFPVRRIFCVGRNYAAHAAEMGNEVDREAPFYFTKSAHALVLSGAEITYPAGTADCHYEMEFVIAIGKPAYKVSQDAAMAAVYGYACGIDLTRRDLQAKAKEERKPWDLGKDFDQSAIMGAITPSAGFGAVGDQAITLEMDGALRQSGHLSEMIWSVPEIIAHLSGFYHLMPGDLIYTGTPAGVGPVHVGARLKGAIDGLEPISLRIAP
ncbi:fumarylacetoacetate hydrolase family protein [Roseovarius sp. LXJ103]|uniref:fumarylacetoacetate hydrolase family protein n=1 Tax=Roseovarius carneus TaxID=2853164 RepID=UPI000D60A943|nr:fumarylacetoacetate hydrolase family protein [Roseovarius carneus]MBZ8117275.1 fumarylacetoacetate hydrolase family protein [Roseovarius carneus]PWE36899.1 fumarylacetoacetase [Pelagicola sp. LXJ1103]